MAFKNVYQPLAKSLQESNLYSVKSRAFIWNWGCDHETDNPGLIAWEFKTEHQVLLIDTSLIDDLRVSLFADRFDSIVPEANMSHLYRSLRENTYQLINAIILHLDEVGMFESGRPVSHIFADVIACISFLRQLARGKRKGKKIVSDKFLVSRTGFWGKKLGIFPVMYVFLTMKIQTPTTGRLISGTNTEHIFHLMSMKFTKVCETSSFLIQSTISPLVSITVPRPAIKIYVAFRSFVEVILRTYDKIY